MDKRNRQGGKKFKKNKVHSAHEKKPELITIGETDDCVVYVGKILKCLGDRKFTALLHTEKECICQIPRKKQRIHEGDYVLIYYWKDLRMNIVEMLIPDPKQYTKERSPIFNSIIAKFYQENQKEESQEEDVVEFVDEEPKKEETREQRELPEEEEFEEDDIDNI